MTATSLLRKLQEEKISLSLSLSLPSLILGEKQGCDGNEMKNLKVL
jgi:hypothetical protein